MHPLYSPMHQFCVFIVVKKLYPVQQIFFPLLHHFHPQSVFSYRRHRWNQLNYIYITFAIQLFGANLYQFLWWKITTILQPSHVRTWIRRVQERGYQLGIHRFWFGSTGLHCAFRKAYRCLLHPWGRVSVFDHSNKAYSDLQKYIKKLRLTKNKDVLPNIVNGMELPNKGLTLLMVNYKNLVPFWNSQSDRARLQAESDLSETLNEINF